MPPPLLYKLGGITLTPGSASGAEILNVTQNLSYMWVPLANAKQIRMLDFPIARGSGEPPVYIRLAVSGRILYNSWPSVEVSFRVMVNGQQYVRITSLPDNVTDYWPRSVAYPHGVGQVTALAQPLSDDPSHGTGDGVLVVEYAIRWTWIRPPPPYPPDPYGGPALDDPRAFEWSAIQVEWFTW